MNASISRTDLIAARAARRRYAVGELLTTNPKIVKRSGRETVLIHNYLVHLSAGAVRSDEGQLILTCSHGSPQCMGIIDPMTGQTIERGACLVTAGRAGMVKSGETLDTTAIAQARRRRTLWYGQDRETFLIALAHEITRKLDKATREGAALAIRLNGTSDIPYERVPVTLAGVTYPNLFAAFPEVQFYDYTKLPGRTRGIPANYHLTFSLSEENDRQALYAIQHGRNVAAVLKLRKTDPTPPTWGGYPTVDGDADDLRYLDPAEGGHVIVLRPKGIAKRLPAGGFVRDPLAGFEADRKPITGWLAGRSRAAAAD